MSVHYVCSPAFSTLSRVILLYFFISPAHCRRRRVIENEGDPVDERCSAGHMIMESMKEPKAQTASRFPKLAQHRVDGVERGINLFSDLCTGQHYLP